MSNTRAQGQVQKAIELLKELDELDAPQAAKLRAEMNGRWAEKTATFEYVSSMISNLIDLVRQLRARQADALPAGHFTTGVRTHRIKDVEVPEGRYAALNTEGKWAFYRVTAKGKVYVFRSDETQALPFITARSVKAKIVEMGLEASAETFGKESKFCYKCGHRLTDDESRSLGIGPKCRSMVA